MSLRIENKKLHAASLEYARVYENSVARSILTSGLLDAMAYPEPAPVLAYQFGVVPEKVQAFTHMLDILVNVGLAECHPGTPPLYRRVEHIAQSHDGVHRRRVADSHTMRGWMTQDEVNDGATATTAFLGNRLEFFRDTGNQFSFNAKHIGHWRGHLTNPMYDFGRSFAVRSIARRDGRYLDLAAGIGLGAKQLAEYSDGACSITLVDKSTDFLDLARSQAYPTETKLDYIHADLNAGIPYFPADTFDGIMFVGAFHYMANKRARLMEIYRILKPGSTLVIANCFVKSGFSDQAVASFSFSLTDAPVDIVERKDLLMMLDSVGFEIEISADRGSSITVKARRPHVGGTRGN